MTDAFKDSANFARLSDVKLLVSDVLQSVSGGWVGPRPWGGGRGEATCAGGQGGGVEGPGEGGGVIQ